MEEKDKEKKKHTIKTTRANLQSKCKVSYFDNETILPFHKANAHLSYVLRQAVVLILFQQVTSDFH